MSNWCLNSLTSVCYNCQRKCSLLNPKKSEAIWNFVVTETWINGSFCIWPFPQLWISENKGNWASCSLGNWNYAPLCIRSYLFIIVFTCSHWTNWCLLEFKRYQALVEALFLMIFTWWWMLPFSSSGGGEEYGGWPYVLDGALSFFLSEQWWGMGLHTVVAILLSHPIQFSYFPDSVPIKMMEGRSGAYLDYLVLDH